MTVFGDLETSVLSELPAGRAPITTHVVPADKPRWLERTWELVREQAERGNRVYVVCPRIDADDEATTATTATAGVAKTAVAKSGATKDASSGATAAKPASAHSGTLDDGFDFAPDDDGAPDRPPLRAVTEVLAELQAMPLLTNVPKAMLHGRMLPAEKDRVMSDFANGTTSVLVSTTVIEVGVDVPEATVMVIMDADRFGISQLHQLRGRVGRSDLPSLCMLISSADPDSPAGQRLQKLAETSDGFELAQFDLEARREGDVLGAAQSGGTSSLRLLRVVRDAKVIGRARADAEEIIAADPHLAEQPHLLAAVTERLTDQGREFIDRS